MDVINAGSVETIVVNVTDQLGEMLVLPNPTMYDIRDTDGNPIQMNQIATIVGMQARCLVNATSIPVGDYELFLKFTSAPEAPVLGPHRFRVQ